MNPAEIENCMKTMTVLYDTREHETPALRRRLNAMPCKHERRCLRSGDYSVCCELSDGSEFSLESKVAIERKMSLDELCGNFTQGRRRFENEFERMKDIGGRMYIVVENADWRKILGGKYRSRFNAKSLTASLLVWCARYNTVPVFCTEYEAPDLIYNILYYELREHLKNYEK